MINTRRSFANPDIARTPRLSLRLVHSSSVGIQIDEYRSHENSWTEIKSFDLEILDFTMIHRDGKLIIIGGLNAFRLPIKTVILTFDLPPLYINNGSAG